MVQRLLNLGRDHLMIPKLKTQTQEKVRVDTLMQKDQRKTIQRANITAYQQVPRNNRVDLDIPNESLVISNVSESESRIRIFRIFCSVSNF